MKKSNLLLILLIFPFVLIAQSKEVKVKFDNVTQVVFPDEIDYFKSGAIEEDMYVEFVKNALFISPINPQLQETNISVVTKTNDYYNLNVLYDTEIEKDEKTYVLTKQDAFYISNDVTVMTADTKKETEKIDTVNTLISNILAKPGYITNNAIKYKNFFFALKGIYSYDKYVFIRLGITNSSNIKFDFDYMAFYISTQKQKKNTSAEDLQLFPLKDYNYKQVQDQSKADMLFVFDKFTIGDDKVLNIDVIEKNGERNLKLLVDDRILLEAKPVKL